MTLANDTLPEPRTGRTIVLGARGSEAFAAALLDPDPVNERLRGTLRRHRELNRQTDNG